MDVLGCLGAYRVTRQSLDDRMATDVVEAATKIQSNCRYNLWSVGFDHFKYYIGLYHLVWKSSCPFRLGDLDWLCWGWEPDLMMKFVVILQGVDGAWDGG